MKTVDNIASIYNLYVDDMYTYALYMGFDKETIMDAIHDVFCKLSADNHDLEVVANIKFYLFRSLKNRLLDIYKTTKRYIELTDSALPGLPFDMNVSIEDAFIGKEDQQLMENQIKEMLNSLTERQREVVYLRYVQEYDYEQISVLLDISVHGCRKLLSKAMKSLRERYAAIVLLLLCV